MISEILPFLEPGDVLIDGGNSHFTDTDRRSAPCEQSRCCSWVWGSRVASPGRATAPARCPAAPGRLTIGSQPVLQAAAAQVNGEPCVAYLGPGSAGHYVKMVHNGIEYGLMELIAETYDFLKRALGLQPRDLACHIRAVESGGAEYLSDRNHLEDFSAPGRQNRPTPGRPDPG